MRLAIIGYALLPIAFFAGVFVAVDSKAGHEPDAFCTTGNAHIDEQMAQSFIMQYFVTEARLGKRAPIPLREVMSWRAKSFIPQKPDYLFEDGVVGWAYLVVSEKGHREISLITDESCNYEIRYSPQLIDYLP